MTPSHGASNQASGGDASRAGTPEGLVPGALAGAPSLIEAVFPAQKISFEAQRERKAGASQTLTALGSYWKGRKPLILVRAILLGILLPRTDDPEKDLEVFERLMTFDEGGLARREPKITPAEIARRISLPNPWTYFKAGFKGDPEDAEEIEGAQFPLDVAQYPGLSIRWRRDVDEETKRDLIARALATFDTYEERAGLCKRPEEVDQEALYAPVWPVVNAHLGRYGIEAHSHPELVEQLGVLRFGHRPRVGDTFCGGGSIPFEAARLGCDVYASDLNPIACMLTWGALNIIGAPPGMRAEIEQAQREVAEAVDRELTALGIEHNSQGDRAKAFLYCLETRCPETGWMVPMAPSWVISKTRRVVAQLMPDHQRKRFDIQIKAGASEEELAAAEKGTVKGGDLVYQIDGRAYRTSIKTLRGDYKTPEGRTENKLRKWSADDSGPDPRDVFQERLYCIQWTNKSSLTKRRKVTYFSSVLEEDLEREEKVNRLVRDRLSEWQDQGLVPDMKIEVGGPPRYQGRDLVVARGWTHWNHLFNPRQLLLCALFLKESLARTAPALFLQLPKIIDHNSRLSRWNPGFGNDKIENALYNQAFNTVFNYGSRALTYAMNLWGDVPPAEQFQGWNQVSNLHASESRESCDVWLTDPPYGDAVMYHEITEFFIAWLRKNPPPPFDQWKWDSRRELAIKGSGDDFRRGMVDAYRAMTEHMPDNGMQCVMFTHQDTGVWSDMVSIFWASGLQVAGAWYIATETTSELKKGGYVQGTVILVLRKRAPGERPGFKQRILPQVKREVDVQIRQMLHLNQETEARMGAPVFNDSDLQMAGYAAALKVLTGFTSIGDEDVTRFALRPRRKGETTVVDEIVDQAAETANSLLVPDGLDPETWQHISGIQRFYLRMLDMETTGASKLDNYQNFAKAFRVRDYGAVMASTTPNAARLKAVRGFKPRDLTERTEIGATPLGALIVAIQEFLAEKDPEVVIANLREALVDYLDLRPRLMDMGGFIAAKARDPETRRAAEAIANRIRNQRLQ